MTRGAPIPEGLRKRQGSDAGDTRRQRADDQFWNPQIVFRSEGPRDDLVAGIDQLAESCGLKPYLPNDYRKTLSALFAYRNNMLHNGFEWPDCPGRFNQKKCPEQQKPCNNWSNCKRSLVQKFINRMENDGWPESWFETARRDEKPWLVYMTPGFCAHCVALIDGIIEGTGRYLKERGG